MKVPFHNVEFDDQDVTAIMKALESNILSPRGPMLEKFGQAWAEYVGMAYGWPLSSGTAAIHCALLTLGISGNHWKVFVPSYTCSPTVFPVSYVDAEPVFVDCEYETYGMNPMHLEVLLEEYKQYEWKAAIVTHLYGSACRPEIIQMLQDKGVMIVEDACENSGGKYIDPADKYQGTLGDIGCFSMRGDKMLTSLGTGGVCVSDNIEHINLIKKWSDLGLHNDMTAGRYRDLPVIGYNYEISNVAAAFGLSQIRNLQMSIDKRRIAADRWREILGVYTASLDDSITWMDDYPGHCYYQFPLMFNGLKGVEQLDDLVGRLERMGVSLIPPFWPMHWQPMYRHLEAECPNSEYAGTHVLMFPCYGALTLAQIEFMVQVIVDEYKRIMADQ